MSIVCTNYNKGQWIRDALDGFLIQKTNFSYEIIIIDDKSTDESVDIIKEYATKHQNKIRAFYNKKNLGITKTWKKACKEARGKYIARCDGDDYWIDEMKLQKQVNILEKNNDSLWVNSDFNTINECGEVINYSSFESEYIKMSSNYTDVLVSKGFTMASTWLVDAALMQEVNDIIDIKTSDDTFDIQLELFAHTKLSYLPEATTIYRVNQGSDSRPKDIDKVVARNKKLLQTQLHYLKKYPDRIDYQEALTQLMQQTAEMHNVIESLNNAVAEREILLADRAQFIDDQGSIIKQQEHIIRDIQESKAYKIIDSMSRIKHKMKEGE